MCTRQRVLVPQSSDSETFFGSKPKIAFPQDPTLQKNIMNGHRFTFLLMNSQNTVFESLYFMKLLFCFLSFMPFCCLFDIVLILLHLQLRPILCFLLFLSRKMNSLILLLFIFLLSLMIHPFSMLTLSLGNKATL